MQLTSTTQAVAALGVATLAIATPASGFVPSQQLPGALKSKSHLYQSSRSISSTPIGEVIDAVNSGVDEEEFQPKREKILKEPALWEYNFGLQDPDIKLPHGIVKDQTAPEKFTITEEQIRTLEEDGVVHIKGVFDEHWRDFLFDLPDLSKTSQTSTN